MAGRASDPANLPSNAYDYDKADGSEAVGSDTHSQIVIMSPNGSLNDSEDIVFGVARTDLAKDLIAFLGQLPH